MAQVTIFAYSDNKFHATLTTRAQNSISAPTCVPETRFCWDLRAVVCNSQVRRVK